MSQPLADRMRPRNLTEFVGQEHLTAEGKILKQIITQDRIPSLILWGPPGSGKTTLARIIANETNAHFEQISAVLSGVKEIREIVEQAKNRLKGTDFPLLKTKDEELKTTATILFIDEIHRFNKAQQDSLLPHVETGLLTLIGATTENPSFEVNSALLSRARVLVLQPLAPEHIIAILKQAITDNDRGLGKNNVEASQEVLELLAQLSNGDARTALNTLELAVQLTPAQPSPPLQGGARGGFPSETLNRNTTLSSKTLPSQKKKAKKLISDNSLSIRENLEYKIILTKESIIEAIQKTNLLYDRAGEEHYNTISAFIKSMRASQPDAALYYLARMVEAGEDPLFIARRMVVFASEDIGLAQPTALVVANAVFQACQTIGYPECAINLAHGVAYLATAKKGRSSYDAYFTALEDVKQHGNLPIPLEIRNAPTKLMQDLGYGKGYEMYNVQSYLPEKLKAKKYFK